MIIHVESRFQIPASNESFESDRRHRFMFVMEASYAPASPRSVPPPCKSVSRPCAPTESVSGLLTFCGQPIAISTRVCTRASSARNSCALTPGRFQLPALREHKSNQSRPRTQALPEARGRERHLKWKHANATLGRRRRSDNRQGKQSARFEGGSRSPELPVESARDSLRLRGLTFTCRELCECHVDRVGIRAIA